MSVLKACDQLAGIAAPYSVEIGQVNDNKVLFDAAMAEMDNWHKSNNQQYASLWQDGQRPVLPVGIFKQLNLSTPVEDEGMWLTSSGTSKTSATQVFFDQKSMARIEKGMFGMFMANGMFSQRPSRFLLLSPDPRQGNFPGYATSFFKYTAAAPVQELIFAVQNDGVFNADVAIEALTRWSHDDAPIFIFGLTVFFEQLALALTDKIMFKGEVKGITGGGWKGLTKTMERSDILQRLNERLEAPVFDIRDIFGLTEHPLHYLSCVHGHFHIPAYSRFFIMGADGSILPAGEVGLIRLQNPFYASLPAHDLLTEDSGSWGQGCACGNTLPYMQYHGRVSAMDSICAGKTAR